MKNEMKNDIALFKMLAELRRNSDTHSPDAFNEVARELFGMTVKEAQMLYEKYRRIATGWWNWSEENEAETIDILTKAKQVLDHSMRLDPADKWRSIESFLGSKGNYDDRNRIGVWAKYEGKEPQLFELWINSPKCLAMLHDMEQREDVQVLCIVPWVDSIYDAKRENCLNDLGDKERMQVYDGDIFVLFNKGVDNYWNKPSENGVYVCRWGAYRRLLYTVGRGYLTIDKKANVASTDDEDDEYGNVFCYDEHRWNSYIMTMDHKWKRIGNIHADVTLLMEKKQED